MSANVIGIVGCGNMGEAIVRGLIASGRDPRSIVASHPRAARRLELEKIHRIRTSASNVDAVSAAGATGVVLLGVKPQILGPVMAEISAAARGGLVVSLAAGTLHATIAAALPGARIVRAMPNQPAAVRAGVTGLWAGPDHALRAGRGSAPGPVVSGADRAAVTAIFEAVGGAIWVPREELFHAVTALSACGPGFLYAIAEALADGGVAAGLPRAMALSLAAHTMAGAGRTLVETGEHPAALKDKVASPAGTTIHGLAAMETAGVRGGIIAAVRAAARRSAEMGGIPARAKRSSPKRPKPKKRVTRSRR